MSKKMFSLVPRMDIPRSRFDRTHTHTTTFDAGYLIPYYWDEIIPGDTFTIGTRLFGRLLTPVVPFMDNLYLDTHFFFVPSRLLFDHFVNMMGEQKNPNDSTDYILPSINSGSDGFAVGSIFDFFGIPTGIPNLTVKNVLPLRAYNLIWNEWFRDENIQDSVDCPLDDGPDDPSLYKLLRRGKRHDYFTSALPWPQKGQSVTVPLGLTAPVIGNGLSLGMTYGGDNTFGLARNTPDNINNIYPFSNAYGTSVGSVVTDGAPNVPSKSVAGVTSDPEKSGLIADLSEATAADINSLREAFAIQRLLEASARGGSRYVELLKAIWRVDPGDARLQRPEYLGGTSTKMNITTVAQTASTDAVSPQGNLAAYGTVAGRGNICTKTFVEHGYIIGLVSCRADVSYQQGLNRMFNRSTRWDFYHPQFAHLGEQAILNKEIYAQGDGVIGTDGVTPADDQVFGYQERCAEYRYYPNMITGKLRSTDPQSLDVWHLAQEFNGLPTLSPEFIEENPPLARVLAVQDEPQIKLDSVIDLDCARPMPLYSVPGLIDHF